MRKTLICSVWSAVLVLVVTASSRRKQLNEPTQNVTDYAATVIGDELRVRVGTALLAENFAKNPNTWIGPDGRPPCPTGTRGCPPSKYAAPGGACNNVRHPDWGTRGTAFLRLLPPHYDDGVSAPLVSVSPDKVSQELGGSAGSAHEHVTSLVGLWAHLLLDDLASTVNPESVRCCNHNHPECNTLNHDGGCREYMRSLPTVVDQCNFEVREQMNIASGFLDGSALYGNDDTSMKALRTFNEGRVMLESCSKCRQLTGLGTLYSALLHEHNRVAAALATINTLWDDEDLFQEARRVVVAEIQHVTFNEFLPTVLGEVVTEKPELKLKDQGYYNGYSSSNHAGTFASVATAALPVLLSLVPKELAVARGVTDNKNHTQLIHAMLSTPAQSPGLHIHETLRPGWDSGSLLVHMARDHGVAAYPHWLQMCAANTPTNFSQLNFTMPPENIVALERVYRNVQDVDLLAGGVLETPAYGAIVGPTFVCLLAQQFANLRNSDRFWYENDIPPTSFSREQLRELRKVTLAGLICTNAPELEEIQPRVLVREDPYLNVRIPCALQPTLDLSVWFDDNPHTHIPDELVMQAVERAEADIKQRWQQEYQLWTKNGGVDPKSPIGTAAAFSKANKHALAIANNSILLEYTSQELINTLQSAGLPLRRRRRQIFAAASSRDNAVSFPLESFGDDFNNGLQSVDISSFVSTSVDSPECSAIEDRGPCDARSQFRSITGHCNNLRKPSLGRSLTTFARLLPPAYENGVSRPRLTSVTGSPLPSPRLVSTMVHADISNLHNRYTLMLMQFAQFTDHDITFTPVHRGFFASIPDCRSCDSTRTVHPECMPIPVPRGDHYYPQINHTTGQRLCFPFMRSLPGQQTLGPRDQINQNSAYLDSSHVYGEHSCLARELRSFHGRLNVTRHPIKGKDLLPQSPNHPECKAPSGYCFIAGDGRASEQPALTVIHTLFMREHNRVADGLRAVNLHWNDEQLYQHARRIVSAMSQHITYNEFLPRILGWNAVNLYELKLRPQGYYKGYSATCNPSIVNEFATAAFRIGHSLLRPHIPRLTPSYQVIEPPILLRDGFFNPDMVYEVNMIDEITRGLVSTPMENMDQFVTGEITNHLFEDRRIPHSGVDLIALNIQRGRDHGLRPYNDYRALCNLKRASSFEDLAREIPQEVIARLKRIYATVDDIDLFPGGMSERPLQGGLVGPTFACIIGIQFRQLRKCDRFWYENEDPAMRFSEAQLAELRKATLSKILCENMDISSDMQRSVFDQPSNFLNPRVPCHSLPHIDLNPWRETAHGCQVGGRNIALGESAFPSPCTSCVCTSEGAQCASLRITDCSQLVREASREAILRDDVCTAQCGFLLHQDDTTAATSDPLDIVFTTTSLPPITLEGRPSRGRHLPPTNLVPPPPRLHSAPIRSRTQRLPLTTTTTFGEFKLPDLSRFIG